MVMAPADRRQMRSDRVPPHACTPRLVRSLAHTRPAARNDEVPHW